MNRRQGESPALLLALAALVLMLVSARLVGGLQVDPSLLRVALPALLASSALLAAGLVARLVATRRTLRTRTRFVVVPADEFDPSPEAVVRFAAQLGRVRRRVRGWLDRRATAGGGVAQRPRAACRRRKIARQAATRLVVD